MGSASQVFKMRDGSAQRGSPFTTGQQLLVAAVLAATVVILFCLVTVRPQSILIPAALLAIAAIAWAARYTWRHPAWLPCALVLIEFVTCVRFLSGPARAVFHYGLIALFAGPFLPAAWRGRTFTRGGFGLYTFYFLWSAVTISYSLAPAYSAGRLLSAVTVFGALTVMASRIKKREDLIKPLLTLLVGCAIIVAVIAASAIFLPRSLAWIVPVDLDTEVSGDLIRFCGIFNGPNDVGQMMLVTVGFGVAVWPAVERRRRWPIALLIATAIMLDVLADSRTPLAALAIGASFYLVWKYRARAVAAMLLIALVGSMLTLHLGADRYLARGDVSTLTGRTEIWKFAVGRIEQRPLTGYGYEVAGAILQSRDFPLWWGPWDEGPHSSLHNGYIDRAVGVGVPMALLWVVIVLLPWYDVLRRREDPWDLKRLAFFIIIPMLIHNMAESLMGDFVNPIGLAFALAWLLGERARIFFHDRDEALRRAELARMPAAVAALAGGILALVAMLALAPPASAQTAAYFATLPPHAALPADTQCAAAAADGISWEPRPGNAGANHTVPTFVELVAFHLAPIKGTFAPVGDFARVDGKFTGTTDQILKWGACKWGIDEDVVRAEAVTESHWRQDDVGDQTRDLALCPSGTGFPGAWNGATCEQSYGIMQMKFRSFGGWPLSKDDTAFNVDFRLAYQRACMNGDIAYLAQQIPPSGYPRYPLGNTDQMLWGCMGDWFSGSWYDTGALGYIAEVKTALIGRTWSRPGF
jgi:O-antigen ligase